MKNNVLFSVLIYTITFLLASTNNMPVDAGYNGGSACSSHTICGPPFYCGSCAAPGGAPQCCSETRCCDGCGDQTPGIVVCMVSAGGGAGTCEFSCGGGGGGGGGCSCTSAAAAPDLETPADGATVNNPITFEWDRGSWGESCCGGRGTRIDIDFDPSFSHIGVSNRYDSGDRDDFTDDNVELTLDFDPGVYYWRVRQYNEEGGHWSNTFSFTLGNQAPECQSITGPTWQRWPGASSFETTEVARVFNVEARDLDMNSMTYVWDSPDCGANFQQVPIDYFDVRVRGQDNNGYPVMDVYINDTLGNRTLVNNCSGYTTTDSWQTVTCDIGDQPANLIEILYSEDDGSRALEIDYINIFYIDGSNKIVQSGSSDDFGDHVFYDRARINLPFMEQMTDPFDGMDVLDGQQTMGVPGSLRFPVPVIFDTPTSGVTCNLRVRATDRHGLSDGGSVCTYPVDICGSPPDKPVGGSPHNVTDWPLSDPLTWAQPPAGFGDICTGAMQRTFTVYGRLQPTGEGACPAHDPIGGGVNYSEIPNCIDMPSNFPVGPPPPCVDNFFGTEDADYCWYVVAENGEYYSMSDVWWFETEHSLIGKEWFTTMGGDLYSGGIAGRGGVSSMELPHPDDYADQYLVPPPPVPWSPPYIAHEDSTSSLPIFSLSDNEMDISHSDPTPGYYPESESTLFAENTSLTNVWPANYTGNPPADATPLPRSGEDCDDIFIHNPPSSPRLTPGEAYEADVTCMQQAIDNYGGDYELQQRGVAAIYVTGSGELRFSSPFVTSYDDPATNMRRIVFITGSGVDVKIDRSLNSPDPVDRDSLTPLIEAAFVASGTQSSPSTFEFEGTSNPDSAEGPDSSIVVEGPIIGRSVILGRNRDIENYFPSEIIKYNSYYLYDLTNKERTEATGVNNFTGLFVTDVDWISEE